MGKGTSGMGRGEGMHYPYEIIPLFKLHFT